MKLLTAFIWNFILRELHYEGVLISPHLDLLPDVVGQNR